MQVRAFIKPDQVALMLSAADWLSDRLCVCRRVRYCAFACGRISRALHAGYVVVSLSEETFPCARFEECLVMSTDKVTRCMSL